MRSHFLRIFVLAVVSLGLAACGGGGGGEDKAPPGPTSITIVSGTPERYRRNDIACSTHVSVTDAQAGRSPRDGHLGGGRWWWVGMPRAAH